MEWAVDGDLIDIRVKIGDFIKEAGKKACKNQPPDDQSMGSWIQEQYNWIGFVAVSDPVQGVWYFLCSSSPVAEMGESLAAVFECKLVYAGGKQDRAIVFRGTITSTEWSTDLDAFLVATKPWDKVGCSPYSCMALASNE